ncbi:MAG TPA: MFS transporter [Thermoanaerobaculia bacterium]|nr:MFS transporter [Thermoanaerobaculia bacterium]
MDAPAASPQPVGEAEPVPAAPSGRLWNRNFTLLWIGQTVSHFGNPAFNIGAMFWMMKATGSASLMGLLATVSMLPGVLLAPFGGAFADRHSRIRIAVISDLIAGLAVLAFALMVWLRPDDQSVVIPLLFAVSLILGLVRAFFGPAVQAALPDLVPAEKLAAANSMNQLAFQASIFSGQALGGVLYTFLGAPALFLIDALSYLFATGCTAAIPRDTPPAAVSDEKIHPFRQLLNDTGEGVRYVWSNTGMRDFVLMASLINFLAAPAFILFPFFVDRYMKVGAQWYGFIVAGISVGSVLGFILAGSLPLKGAQRGRALLAAMVMYPIFASLLVFLRSPIPVVLAVGASGIAVGFINVFFITSLQRSTPAELRGRVMGFLGTLSAGLMPLGMALGGVAGDLTDKNVPLVIGVCAALALLVIIVLGFRRPCREFLAAS